MDKEHICPVLLGQMKRVGVKGMVGTRSGPTFKI